MALELGLVTLGERDPELPQVGYELLFEELGRAWGVPSARGNTGPGQSSRPVESAGMSSSRDSLAREIRPGGGDSDPLAREELENDPWLISFPEAITHRPELGSSPASMPDDANDLSPPG